MKAICRKRETFTVVRFVPKPAGSIAALYLGRRDGKELVYAGKAGTGFTGETARALHDTHYVREETKGGMGEARVAG